MVTHALNREKSIFDQSKSEAIRYFTDLRHAEILALKARE